MLQRQILFKQLKELQQNQQLQDLGDPRKQEYVNQLASLKQGSAVQFAPAINGESQSLRDSQMHALGNMQMMQHGGSNVYQGFPNGFIGSQGQNRGLSLSTPQFDVSGYHSPASNADNNLNFYSQLHGLSSQSDNIWGKSDNKILGTSGIHPSGSTSSLSGQQANFTSDRISNSNGALRLNQMFQENNLFGQVPVQCLNNEIPSANYTSQRIAMQRHEDTIWHGVPPMRTSNVAMPEDDASLDALERKILYETDDDSLGPLFSDNKIVKGGCQGKMSALMQSAVAENLSSDNGVQEDWSRVNFLNQDQPPDNVPLTAMTNEILQNTWVDRNLHDVSSPISEHRKPDTNYGFPGLQLTDHQYSKQDDEFQPKPHALGQQSQTNRATGGTQLIQSLPPSNSLPSQFDEARHGLWPQGSTSIVQANQVNINRLSLESHRMVSGGNVDPMPTNFLASPVSHGQTMNDQSRRVGELLNKDLMQLNSRTSYLSMGNSAGASNQNPYANDYMKNPTIQNHLAAKFSGYTSASSQTIFKPSGVSTDSQHSPTQTAALPPTSRPHTPQQDSSSPKSHKFPYNLFRSSESSLSRLETHSAVPNEQPPEKESSHNSIEMHNLIPLTSSVSHKAFHQADIEDAEVPAFPGISSLAQPVNQNNSVYKVLPPSDTGIDSGKKSAGSYDGVIYQDVHATDAMPRAFNEPNERSSMPEAQEDQSGKASPLAEFQIFQSMEMFGKTDSRSHSTSTNETSNGARPSQISLQIAPSWFKHYGMGTLNSNEISQMFNPKSTVNVAHPIPQPSTGKLQENDVIVQGKPAIPRQGSGVWPASSPIVLAGGLVPPQNLSVDAANQNLDVSMKKKRKVIAFESVPWHKDVKNKASRLQSICMAEEWAHATYCRLEEVKPEAEIIDELPVVQAKRRLVFATLLMQQVFPPAPAVILSADAHSDCDSVAYFTSRLVLGGTCNLKSKSPSGADDVPKTLRRTSDSDLSKIFEGLASRIEKLEGDLSRLDKNLSMADVKLENQELERFSVINRFAKFHLRPYPSSVSSSSGPSSILKPHLQRYITAQPMPNSIPEEALGCLSL